MSLDRKYFLKDVALIPATTQIWWWFGFPSHQSSGRCLTLVPVPPANPPRVWTDPLQEPAQVSCENICAGPLLQDPAHGLSPGDRLQVCTDTHLSQAQPLLIPAQGSQNRFCSTPETAQANSWAGKDPLACQVILQPDPFPGPVP